MFANAIPLTSSLERKSPMQDDKRGNQENRLRRPREQVDSAPRGPGSCSMLLEQKGFRFDGGVREMVVFCRIAFVCHEGMKISERCMRRDGIISYEGEAVTLLSRNQPSSSSICKIDCEYDFYILFFSNLSALP